MNIDKYGRVSITEQEAFDALYSGKISDLAKISIIGNIDQYNQSQQRNADNIPKLEQLQELDIDVSEFDKQNHKNWFMPKNYCPDLIPQLYAMCTTDEQKSRVVRELKLFTEHNMLDLLFYLKYLVDTMKQNNIVWGVGRGSSVASYVLYLIGIHRIDSIKYNLDIEEFLKEKNNAL